MARFRARSFSLAEGHFGVARPSEDSTTVAHGDWWAALVEMSALSDWMHLLHKKCPDLISLSPRRRDECVSQLRKALALKRDHEPEWVKDLWRAKQLERKDAPWPQIFRMRRSRYGETKRLREAIELGIPEGLLSFRPCWLVGPEAAAKLFPLSEGIFDVVIFDEASQCPLEQALPAMYRGKRLIVAGDEKQLPPTSFFVADVASEDAPSAAEEDDEATDEIVDPRASRIAELTEEDITSVDNLLDAAVGMLPEEYLVVHYRSEHPALIDYSNQAFYDGKLEMPPMHAHGRMSEIPFEFYQVEGTYLPVPHRTNRHEAQKVVELLKGIWLDDSGPPTVGVVTFNKPQQELIEDIIEEECTKDRIFGESYERQRARIEGNQDVGFFVKNLENVQGDERDVMIFSTTFGRDPTGHFYRRFGPVGASGGERRLNVAVTRAKQKVIVVTSMPLNEIGSALASRGVGGGLTPADYLQLYLAYVEAVCQGESDRVRSIFGRLNDRARKRATVTH